MDRVPGIDGKPSPIVPNGAWSGGQWLTIPDAAPAWCRRSRLSIPRRHRRQDFRAPDATLPGYFRCDRCGARAYALNARVGPIIGRRKT